MDDVVPNENPSAVKHVRCCGRYRTAFTCDSYAETNTDFCNSLKTKEECFLHGTGFQQQKTQGFGQFLREIRRGCLRNELSCGKTPFNDWHPRDQCIWCPSKQGGGSCRPGSDFGICPDVSSSLSQNFAKEFSLKCSPQSACYLSSIFPELRSILVDPYSFSMAEDVATKAPTKPKSCRDFKTPKDCLKYYDDCFWGSWYGVRVCRPISKLNRKYFH